MNNITTATPTISSVELVEIINSMRPEGSAELRHDNFMVKIENHPGIQSPKFLGDYKDSRGRMQKCYHLPKREAELMVMSESLEVQTKVYDRLSALEAHATVGKSVGGALREELEAVDVLARILNVAPSGKIFMVKASLTHHGAAHLVPTLPVYAIDAPPTATGAAPTSSLPTASLTVLLNEHDIGVSAVTANKMLARAGILEEVTRPSSRGMVKKFWSVTEKGLKYGKNVTSPSNPKETQPHWYRHSFDELIHSHMTFSAMAA